MFEFEKTISPDVALVVPAETDRMPCEVRAITPPVSGSEMVRLAVGFHARWPTFVLLKTRLLAPAAPSPTTIAFPLTFRLDWPKTTLS